MQPLHWYVLVGNSFKNMVHIGALIKEKMKERRLSAAAFAKLINTDRNNIYNIFSRQSMDTELLFSISIALEHDFFQYYKPVAAVPDFEPNKTIAATEKDWLLNQFKQLQQKLDMLQKPGLHKHP